MSTEADKPSDVPRRSFVARCFAACAAIVALFAPLASGIVVLLDPVGRKRSTGQWVKVASLQSVPSDGLPHRFAIVDENPTDKWNEYPPQAVGSVYLIRDSESAPPKALSATCPHLGCTVDFKPSIDGFHCPCHNASFTRDGLQAEHSKVSPRSLDSLDVKVEGDVVWVDYRRFKSGVAQQIEV